MLGKPKEVSDDLTNPCLLWRLLSGFEEPGCSPAGGFGEVCEGEHWKDLGRRLKLALKEKLGDGQGWELEGKHRQSHIRTWICVFREGRTMRSSGPRRTPGHKAEVALGDALSH